MTTLGTVGTLKYGLYTCGYLSKACIPVGTSVWHVYLWVLSLLPPDQHPGLVGHLGLHTTRVSQQLPQLQVLEVLDIRPRIPFLIAISYLHCEIAAVLI